MSTRTIALALNFEVVDCAVCGVVFGVDEAFINRRRNDAKSFYCPMGHVLSYNETEADRLRKELETTKRRVELAEGTMTHLRDQRDAAERSRAAHQAQATRLRNRIGKGVCPCCNRTFSDVARHMSGQHPDFAEATS